MEIILNKAEAADQEYLMCLRKQTMVPHLEREGLFYNEAQHLVRLQEDFECAYIVWVDGVKTGLLKFVCSGQQVDIRQLQITPAQQGKGLGRAILQYLFSCYPGKTCVLTVLKHNPALTLYQRLGFSIVGEDQYEFHMQLVCPS